MRSWAGWLLAVGAVAGCGGVEVSGIVRDRDTGAPLPGAIVGIGDAVTRTDQGGNYELEVDLDEDDRPVRAYANAPGYMPSTEFMSVQEGREEIFRDFELERRERRDRRVRMRTDEETGAIILVPDEEAPRRHEHEHEARPAEQGVERQAPELPPRTEPAPREPQGGGLEGEPGSPETPR